MELFEGKTLLDRSFEEVDVQKVLGEQVVGLYFSASWSPPCHKFVPILSKFHEEMHQRGCPFQVVYLSADKTEEDMHEFVSQEHGDWYMLPFADSAIQEFQDQFNVSAIPKLIILRPDGEVITTKGRKEIEDRGVTAFRSWASAVSQAAAKQPNSSQKAPTKLVIDLPTKAPEPPATEETKEECESTSVAAAQVTVGDTNDAHLIAVVQHEDVLADKSEADPSSVMTDDEDNTSIIKADPLNNSS